jgi:hypothetical protein
MIANLTDQYYNNQEFEDMGGKRCTHVYNLCKNCDKRRSVASTMSHTTHYQTLATAIMAATQTQQVLPPIPPPPLAAPPAGNLSNPALQ